MTALVALMKEGWRENCWKYWFLSSQLIWDHLKLPISRLRLFDRTPTLGFFSCVGTKCLFSPALSCWNYISSWSCFDLPHSRNLLLQFIGEALMPWSFFSFLQTTLLFVVWIFSGTVSILIFTKSRQSATLVKRESTSVPGSLRVCNNWMKYDRECASRWRFGRVVSIRNDLGSGTSKDGQSCFIWWEANQQSSPWSTLNHRLSWSTSM